MLVKQQGRYKIDVMAKLNKIPSHGKTSFTDVESVSLINGTLARHGRVASNIVAHDSWANTDGDLDIQDDKGQLVGSFKAQAKTLAQTGKLKFVCPVGFLEYCKTIQPVMLLVADNEAEKVYWLYLDQESVGKLSYGASAKSKTLELVDEQSFSKPDTGYVKEWTELFLAKRNTIDDLRKRVGEGLTNEIDMGKKLLETFRYSEALSYLLDLKKRRWDEADDYSKFRILSNIAAAQCHSELPDEGAKNFLEAYEFQPDLPKAQVNKAMAHILQGEHKLAVDQADMVLVTNPLDAYASSAKIHAMTHLGASLDDILDVIDAAVLNDPSVAHALSATAKQQGLDAEALDYLEKAVSGDHDGDPNILADLGINILESVINTDRAARRGLLNPDQTERVKRAVALLQKAWKGLPDIEDRKHNSAWLFDIAMGYRVLGQDYDAEKANEELIDLAPDNDMYIKNAAVIAMESGKFEIAEAYFKQMIENGSSLPEIPIMLVDTLRYQKKNDEALKLAEEFLDTHDKTNSLYADMSENLFDILLLQEKLEQAQSLADSLVENPATSLVGFLFLARLDRIKQSSESGIRNLEKAQQLINEDTPEKLILDIAEEAYSSEKYDIAAKSYGQVFQSLSDNPYVQRYLRSLFQIGRYNDVIAMTKAIRDQTGTSRSITQFEWGSYLELQDLPNARAVLTLYIDEHPEDEEARLNRAIIDLRTKKVKALDEYLGSIINLENLSLLSEIQLSNLYQLRNQPLRSLDIIYDARRRYPNEPDAHSAYISQFLRLENSKNISQVVDIKVVQGDSALLYEGGHFLIETSYESEISNNEITLDDAEKRGFVGKKKGDVIVLSQNHLSKNEAKITEVQSKYVFALQDSMKNFERRFSERKDLMSFNVEAENFDPLFKQLDQSAERAESTEQMYKEGKLTIDLFAKIVGKNVIEVFYALMATPDLGIRVASGTVEESQQVQELFANTDSPVIVADITAIITMNMLGLKPSEIGLDKFVIAQRTKDLIFALVTQHESIGKKKSMTLYKRNGQYIRQEITASEQRRQLGHLKKLVKWVDVNTQVQALTQEQIDAIETSSAAPEKLDDLINEAQLDTIKLAIGEGRLFYSDDVGLRSLSTSTFGTQGVWTQALLAHQFDSEQLSLEEYEHTTVELISHNYHHVSISPQILMSAAKTAKWSPQAPLTNALSTLSRPEVITTSMVAVLVNFLYDYYKQITLVDKSLVVNLLLSEATRYHDKEEVVSVIRVALRSRFRLNPVALQDITKIIDSWLEIHNI